MPIDWFAVQAVERGIGEIAITDHVDFDPGAPAFAHTTYAQRERVVREAAERWADRGVDIRFGVEITWDRRWEADIRDHLARHAYDFVIGSVHVYRDSPYAAGNVDGWVQGRSLAEIVAPYFDEVAAGARTGLFDAMGHIDFVKRYLVPHVTATDLAGAPELCEIDPPSARRDRHGARDQHERPPAAGGRVVSLGGDRRLLPRARWDGRDHRLGRPSSGGVRVGAGRRIRGSGQRRRGVADGRTRECGATDPDRRT